MKTRTPVFTPVIILIFLSTLFFSPADTSAAAGNAPTGGTCIRRVDAAAPAGGDGIAWATAYNDLQYAMDVAYGLRPCDVWVKAGTYKPVGERTAHFELKNGVAVYGGFSGTENSSDERSWQANPTILSKEIGDTNDVYDNAYRVVYAYYVTEANSILDGFKITKGHADDPFFLQSTGGGIYMTQSNLTFSNLDIENNYADGGGGVYLSHSTAVFNNTTFSFNTSTSGAGLYIYQNSNVTLNDAVFAYNNADSRGGGLYKLNFTNTLDINGATFLENQAEYGGGAYIYGNATMDNVSFDSNHADEDAGGILIDDEAGALDLTLINSFFVFNTAYTGGAGSIYDCSPTFTNVLVAQNTSSTNGGGFSLSEAQPVFTNATFSDNTATLDGAAIYNYNFSHTVLRNSILWGDTDDEIYTYPSEFVPSTSLITYSLVQGCNPGGIWNTSTCGTDGGNNLVDADPLFVDPATNFYQLQQGSPARDKGNDTFVSGITTDLFGGPRILGLHVDLGPYEFANSRVFLPLIIRLNDSN